MITAFVICTTASKQGGDRHEIIKELFKEANISTEESRQTLNRHFLER